MTPLQNEAFLFAMSTVKIRPEILGLAYEICQAAAERVEFEYGDQVSIIRLFEPLCRQVMSGTIYSEVRA